LANNKVQFTLDGKDNSKQAFDSAEKNAKGFAASLNAILGEAGPIAGALALIGGLKAAGDAIKDFLGDSVKASADAQANFNLVSSALRNIGVNAKEMTPGVIDQIDQIAYKTGQNKDEVERVYAQLVRSTGNYKDALKLLPTVIGVSITAHQDLTSAARVTAEAYHGNTRALRSMGIAAHDGQTAIQALTANVQGAADAFGQSSAGQIASFKNSLLSMKETIGDAITKNTAFSGILAKVVGVFHELSTWIDEHKQGISDFISVIGGILGFLFDTVIDSVKVILKTVGGLWDVLKPPVLALANGFLQIAVAIENSVLPAIEKLISVAAMVSDKIGVHLFDGLAESFKKMSDDLINNTKNALDDIKKLEAGGHLGGEETSTATATKTESVTGDNTLGRNKTKHIHTPDENKEFTEFLANLQKELDIQGLRANALAALTALQATYNAVANDATKSVKERTDAEKHLEEIQKILGDDQKKIDDAKKKAAEEQKKQAEELAKEAAQHLKDLQLELGFSDTRQKAQKELNALAQTYYDISHNTSLDLAARLKAQEDYNKAVQAGAKAIKEPLDASQELQATLKDVGNFAQNDFANAFTKAGDLTAKGFQKTAEAAIAGAKKSIGQEAQHRGELSLIQAVEALAHGLLGDPKGFAAAATFAEAGAAYLALASALGGGGGSKGSGGGGGAGSSPSDSGINNINKLKQTAGGTIIINGGLLNMNDPSQADALTQALANFTGQNINIIPR